jgi:hypothetical protein
VKVRQISKVPLRFCAELGVAGITGVLYVATPFCRDWIEVVSGWGPDQHEGSVEWIIVVALLVVTLGTLSRFP